MRLRAWRWPGSSSWGGATVDNFWGWFEDDPDSGIYDEWGTGSAGDYSPGYGNRWIARNTDSDDLGDLIGDKLVDAAETAGDVVGGFSRGALGIEPLTVAIIAGALFLGFQKVTK